MTNDLWARLSALVPDALDRDPTERDAFLDEACRTPTGEIDAALRAEAASLVAAAEAATRAGSFASPVSGVASDAHASGSTMPSAAAPPETVGPWRVTGVLGEGGQGVVYRAVRADGAFEREVALKLLRPGAPGQAWARLAARLGEERRVLARLEHEGIARLYDGGLDDDGRPYLAMELVRGRTLTDYAGSAGDACALTVRQRVALMADVADAVAYAHARLVVHRDLKPSNVLVDEAGQPKLLDFGVAKLLGDEVGDPDLTVPGWMTPAYAAPEQIRRDEITTATDVYALGVLAYEVLVDQRPYDVSGLDPAAFQRTVCEVVPPRASDTAVQVAPSRAKALRGDLDTILAKALAKEPERRYPTAEALSADLRRWLDDLPVEARQPTARYRVGRFVRRHRAGVLGTAVALAVVVGVATTAFARVSNERDRAETEAAKSEAVNDFILGILGESDPYQSGREVTVAEALDQAAERADSALIDEPEVEGIVRYHLGTTYLTLSRVEESEREFERAIELFRESVGPDHANTIDALNGLAFVYFTRGEFDRADAPLREALRAARTHGDDELKRVSDLTANLHVARQQNGDYEEALTLLQESAALSARLPDYDPDDNAIVQGNMAVLLSDMGRHEEALQMRRDALAHWQSAYPPGSPMSVNALMGYGLQLHEVGRPEEGLPYIQESVDLYRSIAESESEPYQLVGALISYGTVLTAADRTTQAAEVLGEAQRLVEASLPPSTSLSARLASAQAGLFQARGEWDAAVRAADRAVETFAAAGRADADGVGWTLATKARALIEGGQRDEALAALRRARAIFSDRYGDAHPAVSTMDSLRAVARS